MMPFDAQPAPQSAPVLRARHDGWSPARQQRFLGALAALRNVTSAAAEVGMTTRSAYKLRQHPAATAFRAAWEAALALPPATALPSLYDCATARETRVHQRGGKAVTIEGPVPARVLIRMLDRAEAKVTRTRKRAIR